MQASNESKTQNISLIPIQELKPLNVKILQLKGVDEQFYSIIINHLEKSIAFEAFDINDITITKYLTNLTLEDFHKINFFFTQFKEIKDIFALFDDMKEDEFKIIKDTENIELFLLIEIRKKISAAPGGCSPSLPSPRRRSRCSGPGPPGMLRHRPRK